MKTQNRAIIGHPEGDQPTVEARSAIADTFAGPVHIEWDATASVMPLGQLPFFIGYPKQAGLFDARVTGCPLSITTPPRVLGRPNAHWIIRDRHAGRRCCAATSRGETVQNMGGQAALRNGRRAQRAATA
jgi:hypothetical protein